MPPKSFFSRLGIHHRDRKAKDSKKSKSKHDVNSRPTSSTSQSTTVTETCSADISYIPTPPTNVNLNSPQDAAGPASSVHQPVPPRSPVLPPPATSQVPTSTTQPTFSTTSPAPNISERLWNEAYDGLKQKEPKLVDAYERILSREFEKDDSSPEGSQMDENSIDQTDKDKRWSQMEWLVQAGLKKTEWESEKKQTVGAALQGLLSLKDLIGSALGTIPQAALAWAGVCFAMQVFVNPTTETKANRDGIVHVISRMKWYCELSILLLKENTVDVETSAGVRGELKQRVIDLYQALLLYLIKSVSSCYRNRFIVFLRDTIKLDDWNGSLQNVEVAENAVRQDSYAYTAQQISLRLEQLLDVAKNQESRLLQDIYCLLQKQVSFQMEKEDKECIQHLRLTDPRDDKKRIEETKGGLLGDSYYWILQNSDFQQWRNDRQSRLLWIKGDPGKGKTMLLCGIVNELKKSMANTDLLSYFFCQATDTRINNATAVLRGLVYLLVDQQPSLISHIRKKYDHAGKTLFEDANAWVALSEIFTSILQDPSLNSTYLIIDALDECVADLPKLLDFIAQKSSVSRVKWIVSSRNWPDIEERLERAGHKVRLCLELNAESVSTAVSIYIQHKVLQLAQRKKYDDKTRDAVLNHLSSNANNTFLWVALVCQNLEKIQRWETRAKLNAFPPGLNSLYERMVEQICNSGNADICKRILALIAIVYQPITLKELTSLVEILEDMSDDLESLGEIISLCGSFLTIREGTIYFVHQSAKDYLLIKAFDEIFPSGRGEAHYVIFSRSLQVISRALRRDIYNLRALGYPIEQVKQPDPDPLAVSRYSCIYWVDHLYDWNSNSCAGYKVDLQDGGIVDIFIRKKYLYWLEALSLCRSMLEGVLSMAKLEALIQGRVDTFPLIELVQDARRLIMYHKRAIENSPLQAYASALMFSPTRSLIRGLFKEEEPKWITIKPAMGDKWSACLQTLEGHRSGVNSVAFSHDSTRLASASRDNTVKIWDASSGECLQTLKGYSGWVRSVAFSHDSTRLASASGDNTVKIWDASSGECLQTLKGHSNGVNSVAFSHDSTRLASASSDNTVKIWDASSGECLQTLEGRRDWVNSVAFSHDSTRLASASGDDTVKIWDASSGECLQTLEGHSDTVRSVVFSHDSTRLASASSDKTVKIWNASSGECLQTLEGHSDLVAFSHNSTRLASASSDNTVKIWDASSGECLRTLEGHSNWVSSVAFSHDSTRLASASGDKTVKIWDASSGECLQTLEGHSNWVSSVAFSHDSTRLASGSNDNTVKIWDASSGECLQTLKGHRHWVNSVAFSHDSTWLTSAGDNTVKIWDASSGKCLQTLKGHRSCVNSVAFSHDSTRLASASDDKTVKIWDASGGECLQTLEGHGDWVRSVAFSHDSTRLASASHDKTVKIWDTSSGECLQTLKGHSDWVMSVAFSHDSTWLASGSGDKTVKIWDTSSGECLQTLSVGKALYNISVDTTGLYLYTEIGIIAINASSALNIIPSVTDPQNPQYQGGALSSDGAWITYNSENLVWLPSEYRPSCSAMSGKTIGIGVGSGKVWLCNFKVDDS